MEIRDLRPTDWPEVAAIYEEGIAGGNSTFELETPRWQSWDAGHLPEHRFVAVEDDVVLGWSAVSPVSDRCCYAGVAEVSVYVAGQARGRGVGRALLAALVESTERAGIWTLQSGIFPENEASVALHTSLGFRVVGVRERLGRLHGVWRDVLLLERRSEVVE
jgi:L-amino acid N-acyltransferase YncA